MVCSYTVRLNDLDANGVSVGADAVDLNGGNIYEADSTTTAASIEHGPLYDDIGHRVDGVRPTVAEAATSVDGNRIIVTFSESLSSTTAPLTAFSATVGGSAATLSGTPTVSGPSVSLTLDTAVTAGQTVTVSYTDPSANDDTAALQDAFGNDADSFSAESVTNKVGATPAATGIAITSDPGDGIYAIGDAIVATVTFDAAVDVVEMSGNAPYVELTVGMDAKEADCATTDVVTRVVCTYPVEEGVEDPDGIALPANALKLNMGAIRAAGSAPPRTPRSRSARHRRRRRAHG